MARTDISAVTVGTIAAGAVLVWSGVKGASVLTTVQELVQGKKPSGRNMYPIDVAVTAPAGDGGAITPGPSGPVGAAIVAQAMKHRGKHPYRYGAGHGSFTASSCAAGAPLDCSAWCSCVLRELGLLDRPLNTIGFLGWSGAVTVPWEQRAAGDLIIWPQHMGIAVSPEQMIHTGGAPGCPCVVGYSRTRAGRTGVARRVKGRTS